MFWTCFRSSVLFLKGYHWGAATVQVCLFRKTRNSRKVFIEEVEHPTLFTKFSQITAPITVTMACPRALLIWVRTCPQFAIKFSSCPVLHHAFPDIALWINQCFLHWHSQAVVFLSLKELTFISSNAFIIDSNPSTTSFHQFVETFCHGVYFELQLLEGEKKESN